MANIGTFTKTETGFDGQVVTLGRTFRVKLVLIENPSENGPHYRAYSGRADVGAAWEETAKDTGTVYLSVKLDDPSFAAPIYAKLFLAEGDKHDLVWQRPTPRA